MVAPAGNLTEKEKPDGCKEEQEGKQAPQARKENRCRQDPDIETKDSGPDRAQPTTSASLRFPQVAEAAPHAIVTT